MRGLFAHASDRMRDDLKAALQARWADSLRARAAIHESSPVPLLDELLSSFRGKGYQQDSPASPITDEGQQAPPDRAARHREAGRR
jgi:hypothetical protein